MKRVAGGVLGCVVALVACGAPSRATDAPGGLDAGVDSAFDADTTPVGPQRSAMSVVAGDARVLWTLTPQTCPITHGPDCPALLPTLLTSNAPSEPPRTWLSTRHGVSLVGDQAEVFFINQEDESAQYVVRMRPGASLGFPVAMSQPRSFVSGLVVDATHVYWCERRPSDAVMMVKRATRAGDGTDVEILAMGAPCPDAVVGGYLFGGEMRLPVTGGVPATFASETGWRLIAVDATQLYVVQRLGDSGPYRIATLTTDGVFSPITPEFSQSDSPLRKAIFDRGELFWQTPLSRLVRLPVTGGSPQVVGPLTDPTFAVTADAILYDFSERGYETMPR